MLHRVLDPTGTMLEVVCTPVRQYLQGRPDTVRCIVSSLTNDSKSELYLELAEGKPLELDEEGSEAGYNSGDEWFPDPVDAIPSSTSKGGRRGGDITSMLVNIYGSRDLFVDEYQTLLAERLLASMDFDTNTEVGQFQYSHSSCTLQVRNLELLKLRFGEEHMHQCEVMLKDIADSKRISTNILDVCDSHGLLRLTAATDCCD